MTRSTMTMSPTSTSATPTPGRPPPMDHMASWVFDLDNTLYPASCDLFAQIDLRMRAFIRELLGCGDDRARQIQKHYDQVHGTTLRGLMDNHGVAPEAFLDRCHELDLSVIPPSPALDAALDRLEGRKLIFTNATARHAEAVTERLGVGHHFEGVFDIVAADYVPKPEIAPYRALVRRHGLAPGATVMVEDRARNLLPAHQLGMTTVWVRHDAPWASEGSGGDHVHHVADELVAWLEGVAEARAGTV